MRRVRKQTGSASIRRHGVWRAALVVALVAILAPASSLGTPRPAHAAASQVLILSTTVYGGTSSFEAEEVTADGLTPVIETPDQWATLTASQFQSYRAIVLGDPNCSLSDAPASAAEANASTWGPLLTGNVIVIGTDPVFHTNAGKTGAEKLIQKGIDFAVANPSGLGAYIDLSCYYEGAASNTPVPLLNQAFAPENFTVTGVGCGDTAHLVAQNSVLAGLSDADLTGWSCSVHEGFQQFAGDFIPLAMDTTSGTYTTSDGSIGTPYILAKGVTAFPLSLSPTSDTGVPGGQHMVTAQLLDASTGLPVAGKLIGFDVLSGPNAGASGTCSPVSCATDANGHVTWTYTSHGQSGVDTIQAFVDLNANGNADSGEFQTTAAMHWKSLASYYQMLVKNDGAFAYWPMDEHTGSTVAEDAEGNITDDGILAGGVWPEKIGRGPGDTSYQFDGHSGYVHIPYPAVGLSPDHALSVEAWVRMDGPSGHAGYVFANAGPGGVGYSLWIDGAGTPNGTICTTAGCSSVTGSWGIADGSWHLLDLTYDGSTAALYVDAEPVRYATTTGDVAYPQNSTVTIGARDATTGFFQGDLDDVAFYDTALTADRLVRTPATSNATGHFPAGGCPQSGGPAASVTPPVPDAGPGMVHQYPTLPLQTNGRYIVDAHNQRVKLAAVSWYGMEAVDHAPSGLQCQPLAMIVSNIVNRGFNAVRLPWATDTWVEGDPSVPRVAVAANPQLYGLRAHELMDAVIKELSRQGLMIILDNHVGRPDWCCNPGDGNGLWWTGYDPTGNFASIWNGLPYAGKVAQYKVHAALWARAWYNIIGRYAVPGAAQYAPGVIGAELRNEPRADKNLGIAAVWGDYLDYDSGAHTPEWEDWPLAAQTEGNAIFARNHTLLIFVDGVDLATRLGGQDDDPAGVAAWPYDVNQTPAQDRNGGRGVAGQQVTLSEVHQHHVVYVAHDYAFSFYGNLFQSSCYNISKIWNPGAKCSLTSDQYQNYLDQWWGYILGPSSYQAPIWVSEFGICNSYPTGCGDQSYRTENDSLNENYWFQSIVKPYLQAHDVDWSFWSLNGTSEHETLSPDACTTTTCSLNGQSPPEGGNPRFLGVGESYGLLDAAAWQDSDTSVTNALYDLEWPANTVMPPLQ